MVTERNIGVKYGLEKKGKTVLDFFFFSEFFRCLKNLFFSPHYGLDLPNIVEAILSCLIVVRIGI